MLQSLKASGSVYFLELNISKPHIIAVILQSGIAGLIGCKLFHSCEFAVGDHLIPLFGSNLILENGLSILEMNNSASVDQNLCLIPLSKWIVRSRSEEHTSELQSRGHLVCRRLLVKK